MCHIKSHLVLLLGFVVELCEERVRILEQFLRVIVFFEHAALEDQDSVGVDDCVQSMSDGDDCAVLEGFVHCLVDDRFGPHVDVCSCLVDQHDSGGLQDGAGDADQLSLTGAQVLSIFCDFCLQALAAVHGLVEGAFPEGSVECLIGVFSQRIEILNKKTITSRMVPANKHGSCKMMVILDRRSSKLN